MNCRDYQEWLQRRLDGDERPASADADQHLAGCAECRGLDNAQRLLLTGLANLPKTETAPLMTQSIVAAVLEDQRRRQKAVRRSVLVTLSLAASLLLFMLAGWLLSLPNPEVKPLARMDGAPPETDVPKLAQSADDARMAMASLTERVADQTKEQAKMLMSVANSIDLPPMASLPSLSDLEQPLDPAADSLRQAGDSVASGIEPIASSARRAFRFFKDMPMFEIPQGN